ncbi:MAG: response regulator [Pseudomonadota bacterium]|nr:response regulator [Pseudomonadota bacterium]
MEADKVLIVDDDPVVRNLVSRALADQYQVVEAADGREGLAQAASEQPDFVLLDVEMPGMNGYEVCDCLKQDAATRDMPVLFLSSRGSVRERMLGYEAGATDYIVKPFEAPELLATLSLLGHFIRQREALNQQAENASQTAFMAMRGSSELGMAIQFIESTYNLQDFASIAQRFFAVTGQLGLRCTLMFQTRQGRNFYSPRQTLSPLEKEVMETLFDRGQRFNDFGCRTQINYPRVALLVKNMPLDNQEAYGRYKDFLPTMLGTTDAKIHSLDTEQALLEQTRDLTESFRVVRDTLVQVGQNLQSTQGEVINLMQATIGELDGRIPTLGLEDDQEKYLINTLDTALESSYGIVKSGEDARNAFNSVCRLLDHLAERQHKLVEAASNREETPQHYSQDEDDQITGDVELF